MSPQRISLSRSLGRVPLAIFTVGAALGCAPAAIPDPEAGPEAPASERMEVDISHHFTPFGAEGAFVLYDPAADRYLVHDAERSRRRFLPASTFKILNSLIALETGALADENEIIPWDGVDRGDWWNGDQAMTRAFQRSSVWFYQEVARRVGEDRMREWVERVGYGNMDIGGGIERFWLDGDLRISAEEQIQLLRRLHGGSLPFSDRSMEIVRRVMLLEEGDGYVLRGKTGWARHDGINCGWLVGWVEREEVTHFFATQIESDAEGFPMQRAQREITRGALEELGVLEVGESQDALTSLRRPHFDRPVFKVLLNER